jgi:SOS response regulatory protein OraA/RecX
LQESKNSHIIIEEPELNLFPKSQSEIIKSIIENISSHNSLFIMTHSPYVLSTLNTLMMAHKAGNIGEDAKEEVTKLINEKQWINPNDFSAYYLENGMARSIKGRTGLISDNEIDEISDDMTYTFEELLTIYREHKNDK